LGWKKKSGLFAGEGVYLCRITAGNKRLVVPAIYNNKKKTGIIMSFELTGILYDKLDTQNVTDTFKKREFIIEKKESVGSSEFTDLIKFQLTQDRCDLVENFRQGDEIKVSFNLRGRKWEKDGKVSYFTNLEAWRIEKLQATQPHDLPPLPDAPPEELSPYDDSGDLPF